MLLLFLTKTRTTKPRTRGRTYIIGRLNPKEKINKEKSNSIVRLSLSFCFPHYISKIIQVIDVYFLLLENSNTR